MQRRHVKFACRQTRASRRAFQLTLLLVARAIAFGEHLPADRMHTRRFMLARITQVLPQHLLRPQPREVFLVKQRMRRRQHHMRRHHRPRRRAIRRLDLAQMTQRPAIVHVFKRLHRRLHAKLAHPFVNDRRAARAARWHDHQARQRSLMPGNHTELHRMTPRGQPRQHRAAVLPHPRPHLTPLPRRHRCRTRVVLNGDRQRSCQHTPAGNIFRRITDQRRPHLHPVRPRCLIPRHLLELHLVRPRRQPRHHLPAVTPPRLSADAPLPADVRWRQRHAQSSRSRHQHRRVLRRHVGIESVVIHDRHQRAVLHPHARRLHRRRNDPRIAQPHSKAFAGFRHPVIGQRHRKAHHPRVVPKIQRPVLLRRDRVILIAAIPRIKVVGRRTRPFIRRDVLKRHVHSPHRSRRQIAARFNHLDHRLTPPLAHDPFRLAHHKAHRPHARVQIHLRHRKSRRLRQRIKRSHHPHPLLHRPRQRRKRQSQLSLPHRDERPLRQHVVPGVPHLHPLDPH